MSSDERENGSQQPENGTDIIPSFSEWLSSYIGFKIGLPTIKMPQTLKNFDKAAGMLVLAVGGNFTQRIAENTSLVSARGELNRKVVRAGGLVALESLKENTELASRAVHYATNDLFRKQCNREAIFNFTTEELQDTGLESGEPISDDWLVQCVKYAEDKSEPDVQLLWAKIIAGEIRQPGQFPLRFIAFFSTIDHALALKISSILSYSINKRFVFFPDGGDANQRGDENLSFDAILEMEEVGIISGSAAVFGEYLRDHLDIDGGDDMVLKLEFVDQSSLKYHVPRNDEMMGGYPITQVGRKLLSIIKPEPPPETYVKEIDDWGKSQGWIPKQKLKSEPGL